MRRVRRLRRHAVPHHREFLPTENLVPPEESASPSAASELLREKLELHAQLFEAAQIQRKLSGPRTLRVGEIQLASEVFAARFLSGDFVSISAEGPVVWAALGDIAGKGLAAGMWFTNLVGLLHRHCDVASPSDVAAEINRYLCCMSPGAPFVTMFLLRIDTETNEALYCSAGHHPPLLLHENGTFEKLEQGGPLLGALKTGSYETGRVSLQAGDALVAYSDGLLECRNGLDEELGPENLQTAARASLRSSAHATALMLLAAIQDFANGMPICDDMSLMVVQRDRSASEFVA